VFACVCQGFGIREQGFFVAPFGDVEDLKPAIVGQEMPPQTGELLLEGREQVPGLFGTADQWGERFLDAR